MEPKNRYLIIVSCGDDSLHPAECNLFADGRNYDLCVNYYGNDAESAKRLEESCSHFFTYKGSWIENLHQVLTRNGFWRDYRYVMKMDDDIIIDHESLNRLFGLSECLELDIAQPAFEDVNLTYKLFKKREDLIGRHTGFIETQVPVFRQEFLDTSILPLIEEYVEELGFISGWGLDLAWSSLASEKKMAVFDSCVATHARATDASGGYYSRFDCNPFLEASEFCRRHDIACHSDGRGWSKDTLYEVYKKEEGSIDSQRSLLSRITDRVFAAGD